MVYHLMDRRGTVFSIRPHFSFETNTIVFMFLLTFTDRVKKYRFFFKFDFLSTPLPYVACPVWPVTHMQGGHAYDLLGNPIPKLNAQ
jgi:hypothetical protein